ncbi:MAG: hypothetical protein AAF791_04495 [Bacteroidota bacterium]
MRPTLLLLAFLAASASAQMDATEAGTTEATPITRSVVITQDTAEPTLYSFRLDGIPYAGIPSADLRRAARNTQMRDTLASRLARALRLTALARDSLASARAGLDASERTSERLALDIARERDAHDRALATEAARADTAERERRGARRARDITRLLLGAVAVGWLADRTGLLR